MDLTEAWPEIEQNLVKGKGIFDPGGNENLFRGGGIHAVKRLEKELNCRLSGDFRLYIERYAPQRGYDFESLAFPFSPRFTLYGVADFWAAEKNIWWSGERLSEAPGTPLAVAIGEDAEQGAVLDLTQPQCPVYVSDEFGFEPLTNSLADFLRIISFREYMFVLADERNPTVDDWMTYDGKEFDVARNYITRLSYGGRLRLWGLKP